MSRLPDQFFCWIDRLAFGHPTKYSIVMFQVSELFYNEGVTNLKVIPDLKDFSISVSENFFLNKGLDCLNVYRKIHVIQLFVFLFFFIFRFKVYCNFILACFVDLCDVVSFLEHGNVRSSSCEDKENLWSFISGQGGKNSSEMFKKELDRNIY